MKPILYLINSFDSNINNEIKFVWNGNQAFKNILHIYDNVTNELVYNETVESMQLKHTIQQGRLTNGKLYYAKVAVIDKYNNISEFSDPVLFYCFSTPTFSFDGIPQDDQGHNVIRNASYQITLSYHQAENDPLQYFEISLYDVDMHLLQSSGKRYNTEDMNYVIANLEDNHVYYVRAIGTTIHGMEVQTKYCYFSVNYIQPAIYSILALENVKEHGYIKIQSNIRAVECKARKYPVKFIDDEFADLTDNMIYIDNNFDFDDDFVIMASGYNLSEGLIMQLSDETNNTYVYFRRGTYDINNNKEMAYIELEIPIGFTKYICHSNYIDIPQDKEIIRFWIKKQNGLYSLYLERI